MTCEERQRYWNERLDRWDGDPTTFHPDWDEHIDACDRCRASSAGFDTLREAIATWPAPPPASAASLARLERLGASRMIRARGRGPHVLSSRLSVPLGLAASVLLVAWLGSSPDRRDGGADPNLPTTVQSRQVSVSIKGSSRATRRLVLEDPGPDARIGRDVLALDTSIRHGDGAGTPPPEIVASIGLTAEGGGHQGGGPIPDSARYAFGFLLGPESPSNGGLASGL